MIDPPHLIHGARLGVSVAVNDHPIVCLVDEVGTARDVIHGWRLSPPVPELPGVSHKPDMHIMVLCKPLDLGQHLAHVLCL